jgi:hypothetical protein
MRTLAIAALAATAVAFGAHAQNQQGRDRSQGTVQTSTEQAGGSGKAAKSKAGDSVNVRTSVKPGSSQRTTREVSGGDRAVIHKRSRTHIVATDDRPSSVTVVKKKKKYAKKKRTRVYASEPSSSMTIVEKRRRGIITSGGSESRTVTRSSSRTSAGVRVEGSTRTTTGSGSRSGSSETTGKAPVKNKAGASKSSSQQGETSPQR